MNRLELVVARYEEDLGWLRRVPSAYRVTVYDKGGLGEYGVALPNAGREAHTYLHHIVSRYDEMADLTVFCQGRPFDHVPAFHRVLRRLAEAPEAVNGFQWLGFVIDHDDRTGSRLFQTWSKNPERRPLPMEAFWRALWPGEPPRDFVFYPGAHFAVTAPCARSRPRTWYERALEISVQHVDYAHCFERCWDRAFGMSGIPADFREAELPIHLRPVRRLGITWSDVPPEHRGW